MSTDGEWNTNLSSRRMTGLRLLLRRSRLLSRRLSLSLDRRLAGLRLRITGGLLLLGGLIPLLQVCSSQFSAGGVGGGGGFVLPM